MTDYPFNVDDPDANPVLDEETFTKLAGIIGSGPDGIGDLVETFSTTAPETIEEMRTAASEEDMETLASSSHKLKGEAGTFGARRLQAQCKALELEARDGSVDQPVERVRAVESTFEETVEKLQEHL